MSSNPKQHSASASTNNDIWFDSIYLCSNIYLDSVVKDIIVSGCHFGYCSCWCCCYYCCCGCAENFFFDGNEKNIVIDDGSPSVKKRKLD